MRLISRTNPTFVTYLNIAEDFRRQVFKVQEMAI